MLRVEIATGSVFEVVSQATIGRNQEFLSQTQYFKRATSRSWSRSLSLGFGMTVSYVTGTDGIIPL